MRWYLIMEKGKQDRLLLLMIYLVLKSGNDKLINKPVKIRGLI